MTGTAAGALAAALIAWAWTPLSAQQPASGQPSSGRASAQSPSGQTPTFRTGIEAVSVDVNVVDRQGVPVRGLKAEDFHVTVAGQPRRVISAEFIDRGSVRAGAAAEATVISSNEGSGLGRLFVFVVDQNTLEPGSVRHVARAANRFLSGLGFSDRSALLLMPSGPNVPFTWAHDRVNTALQRVVGQSTTANAWEFGSLSDARDIANRNMIALRNVGQRECGGGISAGLDPIGGGAPIGGPTTTQSPTSGGTTQGGTTGGSGTTTSGGNQPTGGTSTTRGGGNTGTPRTGNDSCTRELQMRAEWAWRSAQMTSLASISALRRTLGDLERIQGDKTVILISGGWPLDEREQNSLISTVASEAAAARATFFTMFVPGSTTSASRRLVSTTPANDQWLHLWPLETLAGMTGGGSFRVEVSAESAFERLGRELAGYYRIGVEKEPSDADTRPRRMKVQVSRGAVTVRARDIFDVRTYEDRDWAGRLASALEGPIPATGIGVRVTSYLGADPEDINRVKLVLTGEATRLEPGDAKVQVLVRDLDGKKLMAGEQAIGEPNGDGLRFTANVPIAPGTYIIRVAIIDGNGRVGSVDHRADVRPTELGALSASGPLLVRVPPGPRASPHLALSSVRQDERLAMQVDLEGDRSRLSGAEVLFEIAASADGPSLVQTAGEMSAGPRSGWMLAQAVTDMRVLPPGNYIARAKVKSGTEALGEVRRAFAVTEAPAGEASAAGAAADTTVGSMAAARIPVHAVRAAQPFSVDQVLGPHFLGAFLDEVAARPDAKPPMIREVVDRARSAGIDQLAVSDALAAQSAVAAFLRGLTLLNQGKLEHAANSFRSAIRTAPDFYPAMVYLGACYAAGGNDKEASGAWRTALIKEGDSLPLHLLLADSLLRQDRREQALETLDSARGRWPADNDLNRRFVMAALLAGEFADGLDTLDDLVEKKAEDEAVLAVGLLVLYQSLVTSKPIDNPERDLARMLKFADLYKVRGGPSVALVDRWVAEVGKR